MKKVRKVLIDTHVFDYIHEGIRTFLKGIYSNFENKDGQIEFYLIANNIDNLKSEFIDLSNVHFIKLQFKNRFIRYSYEIPSIIKKYRIDYAHFNYFLPFFLSKSCKYVLTIHDVLFLDFPNYFSKYYFFKHYFLFKYFIYKCDVLTTVSQYSANRISHHFNLLHNPIVISNGIDFNVLRKNYESNIVLNKNVSKYILFVSRIEPRKNHISILKVYSELKLWERGYSLIFVGKSMFPSKTFLELYDSVKFKSNNNLYSFENVSHNDLNYLYKNSSVCVFPSLCEGFGIPPLESALFQVPTICSNVTAMKDFNFFDEFHIDPENLDEFKNILNFILDNSNNDYVNSKFKYISEQIKNNYSWHNSSRAMKNIFLSNN